MKLLLTCWNVTKWLKISGFHFSELFFSVPHIRRELQIWNQILSKTFLKKKIIITFKPYFNAHSAITFATSLIATLPPPLYFNVPKSIYSLFFFLSLIKFSAKSYYKAKIGLNNGYKIWGYYYSLFIFCNYFFPFIHHHLCGREVAG